MKIYDSSIYLIRNSLNVNSPTVPEPIEKIPQSDSSITVSSSGGLSSSAPLINT